MTEEREDSFSHVPVLLNEVIEELNIKSDGIYLDGTLGAADIRLRSQKGSKRAGD